MIKPKSKKDKNTIVLELNDANSISFPTFTMNTWHTKEPFRSKKYFFRRVLHPRDMSAVNDSQK